MKTLIKEIGQVSIPVHNVAEACMFYKEKLGLNILFEQENMALLACGGIRLILSVPERAEFDHPSSIIYFNVDDIEDAYATLLGNGVAFTQKPHCVAKMDDNETWIAFFRDPDGNTQALMSEIAE